jgi:3-deoxy-7-phosphoheptulonate synthase
LIIVTRRNLEQERIDEAIALLSKEKLEARTVPWHDRTLLVTRANPTTEFAAKLEGIGIVERLVQSTHKAQLASKEFQKEKSVVKVGKVEIGARRVVIVAGPCSVEGRDQLLEVARVAKRTGAALLRGGAFKPRTSPYEFQGLGEQALRMLSEVRDETELPIVTEVMEPGKIELVAKYADMLQIGARNAQNFPLLKAVGKSRMPVVLKRGMMETIEELLHATEYILLEGNTNVALCERGIRTFERATRNTLDLSAVAVLRRETHLPVLVDPSHATGRRELVAPMAKAAVAAGADGLMIEIHPNPEKALSDADQQLDLEEFEELMRELEPVAEAVGRTIH